MKLSELRPCDVCRGNITPAPYRVRVTQGLVSPRAAREVVGLSMILGGHLGLAEAMAPDPDDAVFFFADKEPSLGSEFLICQSCYLKGEIDLARLAEAQNERAESAAAAAAVNEGK